VGAGIRNHLQLVLRGNHHFGKEVVVGEEVLEEQAVVEVQAVAFGVVVGHVGLIEGEEQVPVLLVLVLPLFRRRDY
jgi:hypothetical protein